LFPFSAFVEAQAEVASGRWRTAYGYIPTIRPHINDVYYTHEDEQEIDGVPLIPSVAHPVLEPVESSSHVQPSPTPNTQLRRVASTEEPKLQLRKQRSQSVDRAREDDSEDVWMESAFDRFQREVPRLELQVETLAEKKKLVHDHMTKVLRTLKTFSDDISPFMRRVTAKQAPGYFEIVQKPMDFGQVGRQLNAGHYESDFNAFLSDVCLIYDNCRLYNSDPGNEYVAHVEVLENATKELLFEIPQVRVGSTDQSVSTALGSRHLETLHESPNESGEKSIRLPAADFIPSALFSPVVDLRTSQWATNETAQSSRRHSLLQRHSLLCTLGYWRRFYLRIDLVDDWLQSLN
jgi:hypothetical protein